MPIGRLSKQKDIRLVLSRGRHLSSRCFRLKFYSREQPLLRIAVIVSKKVSKKAVERNRIKRRFREAVAAEQEHFPSALDIAAFPSSLVLTAPFEDLKTEIRRLAKKI